jgi:hypothetical protein
MIVYNKFDDKSSYLSESGVVIRQENLSVGCITAYRVGLFSNFY